MIQSLFSIGKIRSIKSSSNPFYATRERAESFSKVISLNVDKPMDVFEYVIMTKEDYNKLIENKEVISDNEHY